MYIIITQNYYAQEDKFGSFDWLESVILNKYHNEPTNPLFFVPEEITSYKGDVKEIIISGRHDAHCYYSENGILLKVVTKDYEFEQETQYSNGVIQILRRKLHSNGDLHSSFDINYNYDIKGRVISVKNHKEIGIIEFEIQYINDSTCIAKEYLNGKRIHERLISNNKILEQTIISISVHGVDYERIQQYKNDLIFLDATYYKEIGVNSFIDKTVYEYSDNHLLNTSYYSRELGGLDYKEKPYRKIVYNYSSSNKLVEILDSYEQIEPLFYKTVYKYDINNNLILKIKTSKTELAEEVISETKYYYDKMNNLTYKKTTESNQILEEEQYVYNEKGLLVNSWQSKFGKKQNIIKYEYDENGHTIKKTYHESYDKNYTVEEYISNALIKRKGYNPVGELLSVDSLNDNGLALSSVEFYKNLIRKQVSFEYHNNNLLKSRKEVNFSSDGKIVEQVVINLEYYPSNNLKREKKTRLLLDGTTPSYEEVYSDNKHRDIIKIENLLFDGSTFIQEKKPDILDSKGNWIEKHTIDGTVTKRTILYH